LKRQNNEESVKVMEKTRNKRMRMVERKKKGGLIAAFSSP
jgi:hypothetical protein